MFFRVSILALSMISGAALAQGSLEQTLTQKDGLNLVSDGLYGQKNGNDESYVAVNRAGREALLAIMKQNRVTLEQGFSADGINRTEQAALDDLDASIAELSKPEANTGKAQQERTGFCGSTQVYARAISNGGTSSSAYSVASNATGPVDATANFASTTNGITYQSQNTVGAAPASVSGSNPAVCASTGFATVTCPGASSAAVSAYAISFRAGGLGCWFQ